MTYRLQVIKVDQKECMVNLVPISPAVLVDAECMTEAKSKAAYRLAQWKSWSLDGRQWLWYQQQGLETDLYPYQWSVERVQVC